MTGHTEQHEAGERVTDPATMSAGRALGAGELATERLERLRRIASLAKAATMFHEQAMLRNIDLIRSEVDLLSPAPDSEAVAYLYTLAQNGDRFASLRRRTHYNGYPVTDETPLYAHPPTEPAGGSAAVAWVLECDLDGQAVAYARADGFSCPEPDEAIQFTRRVDAERYLESAEENLTGFYPATVRATPEPAGGSEADDLIKALRSWRHQYDDRVQPLLLAAAELRDASYWNEEDVECVIAFLLSRNFQPAGGWQQEQVEAVLGQDALGFIEEARLHASDMPRCIQRDYLNAALDKLVQAHAALAALTQPSGERPEEAEELARDLHLIDEPPGAPQSLPWEALLEGTRHRYMQYAMRALKVLRP